MAMAIADIVFELKKHFTGFQGYNRKLINHYLINYIHIGLQPFLLLHKHNTKLPFQSPLP